MKLLEIYKYTAMFLSFFIGLCIFAYVGIYIKIAFSAAALLIFIVFLVLRIVGKFPDLNGIFVSFMLICGALILACVLSVYTLDIYAASFDEHEGKSDTVKLKIEECDFSLSYTARYKATVMESQIIPKGAKIFVNSPIGDLENGDILLGNITYTSLDELSSRTFNAKRYYLTERLMLSSDDDGLYVSGEEKTFNISSVFDKINKKLSSMITANLDHEAGGIASAVLLGNRDALSDITERDFRRIGVSHLLVVSGSHFAILISFITQAMRYTKLKRKPRALCSIGFIIFLMGITGFTPSVMRAGIMHIISQLSIIATRRAKMINSFAISGVLIVLLNPFAVLDCGLQLSFAATYGCLIFIKLKSEFNSRIRKKLGYSPRKNPILRALLAVIETLLMTTVVTICILPMSWLYFGEVSVISIPVNVIFIPLITVLMYLTGIFLILYPLRILIYPMALLLNSYCGLITSLARSLSSGENVMIAVNYSFTPFFFIPITVILFLIMLLPRKGKIAAGISLSLLCVTFFSVVGVTSYLDRDNVHITYIGEKKNDGFVLKSNGKALICEISDASFGYSYNLTDEITEMNVCEIEALLLTHYHNKHVQLLGRLCEREILRCIYLPEPIDERESEIYGSLLETAEYYGIDHFTIDRGGSFAFGDTEITLFERKYLSRSTHPITALQISAHGDDVVFLSCSFNQSHEEITSAASEAEYIIFGNHSPVYKKAFGITFDDLPKAMIISEQAYEYMDESTREAAESVGAEIGIDLYRLTLTPNG
ncbi:MAG: hypothetical protein E7672_02845 [Ruminococcaceae bacterium]|nr:hypothetical protein [Oscillospiraceae bacterium]